MTKDIMAGLRGEPEPIAPAEPTIPSDPAPIPAVLAPRGRGRPKGTATLDKVPELRYRHHQIAKMLAEGKPQVEIAVECGLTPMRISQLTHDPAMKELVAFYAGRLGETWDAMHKRLATLGGMAVDELMDKLEADPDSFTKKDLLEIANMALERSGVAPMPKGSVNVSSGGGGVNISIAFKSPEPVESLPPMIDVTPRVAS